DLHGGFLALVVPGVQPEPRRAPLVGWVLGLDQGPDVFAQEVVQPVPPGGVLVDQVGRDELAQHGAGLLWCRRGQRGQGVGGDVRARNQSEQPEATLYVRGEVLVRQVERGRDGKVVVVQREGRQAVLTPFGDVIGDRPVSFVVQ